MLDLGVNFASERRLPGIALHPNFATNGGVLRFGPDGKLYILFGDNGRRDNCRIFPVVQPRIVPARRNPTISLVVQNRMTHT